MARKPGCIEPIVYFVNGTDPAHPPGYLLLAPYSAYPTPAGYRREAADTLPDARRLQSTLQAQERAAAELEMAMDIASLAARRKRIHDNLTAVLASSAASEYEKEFVRGYLQLSDERKQRRYEELYLQRTSYLWALENDTPDRAADREIFIPERHTVRR